MNGTRDQAPSILDTDVRLLAGISSTLMHDFPANDEWEHSPFAWIKGRPSRQVGKIGEMLVAGWLAAKNFSVAPATDSQADRVINGRRAEVKFSTKWRTGVYKFQQLRDQNYDFAICLGVSPFDAHCWAIPKEELLRRWKKRDGIHSQHTGGVGVDTAWLSVDVSSPAPWLAEHGGSLASARSVIERLAPGIKARGQ